jgi:hypothetical protein
MIGLIKQSLYKTIRNGFLSLKELRDVILDVEVILNNRSLSYVEDDIQFPILTPNSLLYGRSNVLPEFNLIEWNPKTFASEPNIYGAARKLYGVDGKTST